MSKSGAASSSAILDSGTPVIITTTAVANGIYGAIGISPSSDGMYYVPCTTPLNMTTLDNRPEICPWRSAYASIGRVSHSKSVEPTYLWREWNEWFDGGFGGK